MHEDSHLNKCQNGRPVFSATRLRSSFVRGWKTITLSLRAENVDIIAYIVGTIGVKYAPIDMKKDVYAIAVSAKWTSLVSIYLTTTSTDFP